MFCKKGKVSLCGYMCMHVSLHLLVKWSICMQVFLRGIHDFFQGEKKLEKINIKPPGFEPLTHELLALYYTTRLNFSDGKFAVNRGFEIYVL